MSRTYISGPMTGLPDFNYPAFNAAAESLRAVGITVENPAENPDPPCKSWAGYMRIAVRQLMLCDEVVTLPGWTASRGARVELFLARILGMRIRPLAEVLGAEK